jgi:hypothetical protein
MKLIIVSTAIIAAISYSGELPAALQLPLPLTGAILFTIAVIYSLKKA